LSELLKINDCMCWFSCLRLSCDFGYMKFVENLLLMLKYHCWYMLSSLLWEFNLNWWKWRCCWWLILNSWFLYYECCWVYIRVENPWNWLWEMQCLVKLLCFSDFCENRSKAEMYDFDVLNGFMELFLLNWIV